MVKYVIGSIIIALFIVWGTYAFLETTIQYVSIEQAWESSGTVQVMGEIDRSSVRYDPEESRLEFTVFDSEADNQATTKRLCVVYTGIVPGNFDQATSVVVKGKRDGEVFLAEQLLVKCPSKYQGDEEQEYQDVLKHQGGPGAVGD